MGPAAFRDGIFSSSDPMSQYGKLLTSYSDGALGSTVSAAGQCQRWCLAVNAQRNTPGRIKPCNRMCQRFPKRWTKRLSDQYRRNLQAGLPATMQYAGGARSKKQATSGLGELDSTTVTAAAIGVALVGGLLWLGSSKKRR